MSNGTGRALALCALLSVIGAPVSGEPEPNLVVVVHPGVAVNALDEAQLAALFTGAVKTWPGGVAVIALNLPPYTAPRVAFDRAVVHMTPEQSGQYWTDRRIRGDGSPPRSVADPACS